MDPMVPGSSNPDHPTSATPSIRRNPDGTLPEDLAKPPAQSDDKGEPTHIEQPAPPAQPESPTK